jgi:hypothetical protein
VSVPFRSGFLIFGSDFCIGEQQKEQIFDRFIGKFMFGELIVSLYSIFPLT